ncbi:MAG: hypothetical protein K0Q86_2884, partial [Arthrobacter koreensis]|uniref:hypothetical protein n=1 Tax=Arthrobacter koreensis TaxID=199136 RepID=UPI00240A4B24
MPVRAGLMRVTVRGYGPAAKALEQLAVSSAARGVHSIDSPAAPDNGCENALPRVRLPPPAPAPAP